MSLRSQQGLAVGPDRRVAVGAVLLALLVFGAGVALGGPPAKSPVVRSTSAPAPPNPKWLPVSPPEAASVTAWTCDKCHSPKSWSHIPERVDFDHDRTGVPLTGAHAKAPCVGCHKGHDGPGGALRRVPRACVSCHTDAHRGEQGASCDSCHTSKSWRTPRRFAKHEQTRFPLTGAHAMTDCRSCHRGQGRDQYRGTPTTCDACHRKQALAVTSFAHASVRPACNNCHSTFAWSPVRFDHGTFWPLVGAHAAIQFDCAKCHSGTNYAAASSSCASCHGQLVDTGKTHPDHKALGFSRTCDNCHTPTAWSALRRGWHDPAFPLTDGEHTRYRNSCSSCHPGGVGKGKFDCVNCHDGEHTKAKMDAEHDEAGYVWDNAACFNCHPRGKAED